MPFDEKLKTFSLSDLVGYTLEIRSYLDVSGCVELIVAIDCETGKLFVLEEISHPINPNQSLNQTKAG